MTQPVLQDERVLDYIYDELGEAERAAFEVKLGEDAALRAEVESLRQVRKEFRALPKVSQSPESVNRMTAMLMQQAAQQAQGGKNSDAKTEEGGGGKLVPFRERSGRRILHWRSPATGIFAAAAAALFWVVIKSQAPTPRPAAPAAFEPDIHATASAPKAAETTVALNTPPPAAAPVPVAPAPTVPLKEAFDEALHKPVAEPPAEKPVEAKPQPPAFAMRETAKSATKRPVGGKDSLDSLLDSSSGSSGGDGKSGKEKPMVVAQLEKAEKKADAPYEYRDSRFAQPPPPLPKTAAAPEGQAAPQDKGGGLRAGIAQTQARRQERIVEELANQELGSLPGRGGGSQVAAAPPPPPPPPAAEQEAGRYAQNRHSSGNRMADDETPPAAPAAAAPMAGAAPSDNLGYAQQAAGPRRPALNTDNDGGGTQLLAAVHDSLQKGHCAEAQATLQKLEQAFPATHGLSEARASYQRTCQPQLQQQAPGNMQMQNLERNQMQAPAPTPALAQPMEAPSQAYAPSTSNNMRRSMPSPAPPKMAAPMRAKKAAPAKAKAADTAASY